MSYADYLHCTRCDKVILYDADCDYDAGDVGIIWALCTACRTEVGDAILGAVAAILGGSVEVNVKMVGSDGEIRAVSDHA